MNKTPKQEIVQDETDYGTLTKIFIAVADDDGKDISYCDLLRSNREYRYFISSYLITHFGEWLTYIASIDFIENHLENSSTTSRTSISILVLVRLLPNVLLSCFGGTLADAYDRRELMIALDICGAICAMFFLLAYQLDSVLLIYVATLLQQCVAGLYQPSHSAIIPTMVRNDKELKKATTLDGLTWSGMQAFGAAASGFIVAALGSRACFLIDGVTYLASAFLLWMVRGKYNVSEEGKEDETPWRQFKTMTVDGAQYLASSFFGALILLKATAALAYGACDVLNVAFSEEGNTDNNSNLRLGILFSSVGIGCLLGPLITEPFVHVNRPLSLQLSCVISFGISAVGYFGWSVVSPFWSICIFTLIRSAGASIIWINSTLLLQKFSAPHMLGRVLAADYALALLMEALAAYICGFLMDHVGLSAYQVSFVLAVLTSVLTAFWCWYHMTGYGAGNYRQATFVSQKQENRDDSLSTERTPLQSETENRT